jgi:hypothetical protein
VMLAQPLMLSLQILSARHQRSLRSRSGSTGRFSGRAFYPHSTSGVTAVRRSGSVLQSRLSCSCTPPRPGPTFMIIGSTGRLSFSCDWPGLR